MLPKRKNHPSFYYTLPISKKEVSLRPMTVEEDKILMFASQMTGTDSELAKAKLKAIVQVLECCSELKQKEIEELLFAEFEFLYCNLRSISDTNLIPFEVTLNEKKYRAVVDLNDIQIFVDPSFENKFTIEASVEDGFVIHAPLVKDVIALTGSSMDTTEMSQICLDRIYFGDDVYESHSISREEKLEYLKSIPLYVRNRAADYFDSAPYTYFDVSYSDEQEPIRIVGNKVFF